MRSCAKNEINRPHQAECGPDVIQFEWLVHIKHCKGDKDSERDGFLHDFELRQA